MPDALTEAALRAYGLLWRSVGVDSPHVYRARKELLAAMTKEQQMTAIAWVVREIGPLTDEELAQLP